MLVHHHHHQRISSRRKSYKNFRAADSAQHSKFAARGHWSRDTATSRTTDRQTDRQTVSQRDRETYLGRWFQWSRVSLQQLYTHNGSCLECWHTQRSHTVNQSQLCTRSHLYTHVYTQYKFLSGCEEVVHHTSQLSWTSKLPTSSQHHSTRILPHNHTHIGHTTPTHTSPTRTCT